MNMNRCHAPHDCLCDYCIDKSGRQAREAVFKQLTEAVDLLRLVKSCQFNQGYITGETWNSINAFLARYEGKKQ